MFLFDLNSYIKFNFDFDNFLFGNIDKDQVTTIVLIVAGVIEAILLIALIVNLSKRSKSKQSNMEAMGMFDNSPTSYSYQEPQQYNYDTTPAPEVVPTPEPMTPVAPDTSMDMNTSVENPEPVMSDPIPMDSGIPSMDYNQETSFDSDNLMAMQKNDTLDVPDGSQDYYDSPVAPETTQTFDTSYNNVEPAPTGFESLENLPDIIEVPNTDPLPTENELGSDPNEIIQPINNDFNNDINISLDSSVQDTFDNNTNMDMNMENNMYNDPMPMDNSGFDTPPVDPLDLNNNMYDEDNNNF